MMRQLHYILFMFYSQTSIYVARAFAAASSVLFRTPPLSLANTPYPISTHKPEVYSFGLLPANCASYRILQAHHFLE